MNRIIRLILMACGILMETELYSQADISMATEWYNRANYNPASISRPDYIYFFTNARNQWTGIKDSPRILNVQVSEYIHSIHSAFGLSMVCDRIGVTQSLNPLLTYAYQIENFENWSLSMGVSAGVFSRSIDGSLFDPEIINDPALYNNMERILKPDANLGFEFQSEHIIIGLSSTHLFSLIKDTSQYLNTNHKYGYVIYKNTKSELLNYSLGLQVVNRYNLTVLEGNATIRFKRPTGLFSGPVEIFDLGITYRSSHQLTCLFGLNLSRDFRIGYAYDQSFLTGYSQNGSHEIMLEYRIPSRTASPRVRYMNSDYWYF